MFVVVSVSFFLWGNTFLYFFSFVNKTRALKIDFNIQRFAELESEISYALGSSWGTNFGRNEYLRNKIIRPSGICSVLHFEKKSLFIRKYLDYCFLYPTYSPVN